MAVDPIKYNQLPVLGSLEAGDTVLGEKVNGTTGRLNVGQLQPSDGDKGDITVSGSGLVWTVDNDAITYAKIQNVSATDKILGRSSALAGDIEEITCTAAGRNLLDDADASAQRTTLGLGSLATQSGTFSGTHSGSSSGTNTGDQTSIVGISGTKAQFDTACSDGNFLYTGDVTSFSTLAVSGQSDIVADAASDTLTIVAGTGITLTTNASTDTLTITGSVGGGGLDAYTTTATAAGTTTLTVSSNYQQYFTGSTTQTVVMPVTSTLVLGQSWRLVNNSTGAVTVNSSGSNLIVTLYPGHEAVVTCISTSGTTAASWDAKSIVVPNATLGTDNVVYGASAGAAITSGGIQNTFIGKSAGALVTSADNNTAVGFEALDAVTSSTVNATAVGSGCLGALTSGTGMVGVGYLAGSGWTTQTDGIAIGVQAASANTGAGNIGIGTTVMANGTASRNNNIVIGHAAANFATGNTSVVIGNGTAGRQHGTDTVYVGHNAGQNSTGASNVAIGAQALADGTGGASANNVAVGLGTMIAGATGAVAATSATGNTCIGSRAGISAADCLNAIAIGRDAVAVKATGATSGDNGPGIAIGSAAFPVGFRGDGTIYSAVGASAGYWRLKINGTVYKIQLYADA